MASQSIKNIVFKQNTLIPNTFQRSFHTSFSRFSEGTDHRKTQQRKEPTRFVQIESLPTTATTEDIRKLAREAFHKGDQNIVEMVFCRNAEFNFTGRCVVSMVEAEDARRLVDYGNRRLLGGKVLKMNHIGDDETDNNSFMSKYRRSELISMTESVSAAGRSVIMSGLPLKTRPENVLGFLRSRNFFPLEGSRNNVLRLKTKEQAVVSKFLVKFDSESEAWRCVRAFHNSDFLLQQTNQKFKLHLNVAY